VIMVRKLRVWPRLGKKPAALPKSDGAA
jgi:hypothetical protein